MADATVAAVELQAISKRYGNVLAVDGVSLSIARGTVHALVGANGAGKSTVGRMIAGAITVGEGRILVGGEPVSLGSPREALEHGVALIAQELALAPDMTVLENVYLGVEDRTASVVDRRALRRRFDELLASSGFSVPRDARVRSLSIADQQKVEILRALSRGASIIVMDEPTSSLTRDEAQRLHALIRDIRTQGMTIVYVSHFLDEVLELADDITILRNGALIRTGPAAAETEATIVTGMLGHSASAEYPARRAVGGGDALLEVSGLRRAGVLDDVSLTVAAGEIVGLAGLVGSGRSELARAIFGADPVDGGTIRLAGTEIQTGAPHRSFRLGIAMVPESRKEQGLLLDQPVAANTTLPFLGSSSGTRISRFGWLSKRTERDAVRTLLADLSVTPASPAALVKTMSGGNQQKVLFGKCLFHEPRILILDEPTRGVDVGARRAIHELIGGLAARGVGIILISSDLEEVLGLAHRVLVMRRGAIVAEFGADPPMDTVMEAAFGMARTAGAA
jgi:simple sugar transport system ATP-binding protein/ribose transport system ATP-binding protein